jgi:hypothetical protein
MRSILPLLLTLLPDDVSLKLNVWSLRTNPLPFPLMLLRTITIVCPDNVLLKLNGYVVSVSVRFTLTFFLSNKWSNSIKHYAKLYEISVVDDKGKLKSVNRLSNEIYAFEKENKPEDGLYPFLRAK